MTASLGEKRVSLLKALVRFGRGYASYLRTGKHDKLSFLMMRELFCRTNGRLNDFLAWAHRVRHRPYRMNLSASFLEGLDQDRVERIVKQLDRDGYYVFDERLPGDLCDRLVQFAMENEFCVVGYDDNRLESRLRFDPHDPVGVRYDADMQQILECAAAQRVVADPGLIAIAQSYFRAKAVQDMVAMWWSAPGTQASSAAAQMYHFDMPRVKFVKFFVYLTDVDEDNGPHCFVAGSHRRLPGALRRDGRLSDDEVQRHYPPERLIEIKGPKGTICAIDTRGLHKGKQLVKGHRLMFQTEFAINLFGASYPKIVVDESFSDDFVERVRTYPYTFSNYEVRVKGAPKTSRQPVS